MIWIPSIRPSEHRGWRSVIGLAVEPGGHRVVLIRCGAEAEVWDLRRPDELPIVLPDSEDELYSVLDFQPGSHVVVCGERRDNGVWKVPRSFRTWDRPEREKLPGSFRWAVSPAGQWAESHRYGRVEVSSRRREQVRWRSFHRNVFHLEFLTEDRLLTVSLYSVVFHDLVQKQRLDVCPGGLTGLLQTVLLTTRGRLVLGAHGMRTVFQETLCLTNPPVRSVWFCPVGDPACWPPENTHFWPRPDSNQPAVQAAPTAASSAPRPTDATEPGAGLRVVDRGVPFIPLDGHQGGVRALAELPDGRLVTGCDDGCVRVWDLDAPRDPRAVLATDSPVESLLVTPDGRVISGHFDGRIRVWDLGRPAAPTLELAGHAPGWPITALGQLARGRFVSGSFDGTVRIWDLAAPERAQYVLPRPPAKGSSRPRREPVRQQPRLVRVPAPAPGVPAAPAAIVRPPATRPTRPDDLASLVLRQDRSGHSLHPSPDGRRLASIQATVIEVWNLDDPDRPWRTHRLPNRSPVLLAWLPGDRLILTDREHKIWGWDLATPGSRLRHLVRVVRPQTLEPILACGAWVAVCPNATADGKRVIELRRMETPDGPGRILWAGIDDSLALELAAGRWLHAWVGGVGDLIWDLAAPDIEASRRQFSVAEEYSARLMPDGRRVIAYHDWEGKLRPLLYDLEDEPVAPRPFASGVPKLQRLHTGPGGRVILQGERWTTAIWDPARPEVPPVQLRDPHDEVRLTAAGPGDWLATAGLDGRIRIRCLRTAPDSPLVLTGHCSPIESLAWFPDGRLATGDDDGELRIWDVAALWARSSSH